MKTDAEKAAAIQSTFRDAVMVAEDDYDAAVAFATAAMNAAVAALQKLEAKK